MGEKGIFCGRKTVQRAMFKTAVNLPPVGSKRVKRTVFGIDAAANGDKKWQ